MSLQLVEEKKDTDAEESLRTRASSPTLVATSPSNDFYSPSGADPSERDTSCSVPIQTGQKHHVENRYIAPKTEDSYDIDENQPPASRVHKVPPPSPLPSRKDDNDVDAKLTDEKNQMTPHQPYYPYAGAPCHAHPPFPYPTPHQWGYYPPYYPPPFHYPPASHTSGAAMIASSPYYPPVSYPGAPPGGPMPPSSNETEHHPTFVPGYPYYGAFPPPRPGQHPPMSPLMQQPLFNSPGPSPSNQQFTRYYAPPGSIHRKGHQQSSYPHHDPGLYPPPFFPPSSEFVQSDAAQGKKKKKNRKGAKRVSESFSAQKENVQEQQRAVPPYHSEADDVLSVDNEMNDHENQIGSSNSVDSIRTPNSNPHGSHPLATYVKPRLPTNQEELVRRARKNSQARARADFRKARCMRILTKDEDERTPEEMRYIHEYERGRSRKNNRSRSRAVEHKDRVDAILKKAVGKRSKIEVQFLEQYLQRKQRKNEGDRLRRERLKILGLDSKKPLGDNSPSTRPTVSARGPLPPDLVARAAGKDSKLTPYGDPTSPGFRSQKHDPYMAYGHHPPPGYAPFHAYPPPPYWNDNQAYPHPPSLPVVDDENRPTQYRNNFMMYPAGKEPSPPASWSTPPRHSKRSGRQTVVTSERDKIKDSTSTTEKENNGKSDNVPALTA